MKKLALLISLLATCALSADVVRFMPGWTPTITPAGGVNYVVTWASGTNAALWTPADAGPQLWLDASVLNLTNNAKVATWTDSGTNGWNATQTTAGKRPIYRTDLATKGVVNFDGATQWLSITNNAMPARYAQAYVVAYCMTTSTFIGRTYNLASWIVGVPASGAMQHITQGGTYDFNDAGWVIKGKTNVFTFISVTNSGVLFVKDFLSGNGTNFFYVTDGAITYNANDAAAVGAYRTTSDAVANLMNGWIGEIVLFHTPDNADYTLPRKVEGYLAWKWGLQGSLPTNHPYKAAAPTK